MYFSPFYLDIYGRLFLSLNSLASLPRQSVCAGATCCFCYFHSTSKSKWGNKTKGLTRTDGSRAATGLCIRNQARPRVHTQIYFFLCFFFFCRGTRLREPASDVALKGLRQEKLQSVHQLPHLDPIPPGPLIKIETV